MDGITLYILSFFFQNSMSFTYETFFVAFVDRTRR
jgi:hypothetical protein